MGLLIDGKWHPDRESISTEDGAFERDETTFRDRIEPDGPHPPAEDRYHLYISRACPWAHRTMVVRALKGLEGTISVDIVDPVRIDDGWEFSPEKPDCTPDTVNGSAYLREVYQQADDAYTGRVSVPVLWDREKETIVNNESSDIIQLLDEAFEDFARHDVTLYPDDLAVAARIDELYESINNGVYKAGFSTAQDPYEVAVQELFDALEYWNETLADQRYVCGDRLTAADVCLFTTLYRFDEIYHTHFKCNHRRVTDYEHLWDHTREMYQLPGVEGTCNMDHCKTHYYVSHAHLNPNQIVPMGPEPPFDVPHGRESLSGEPPRDLVRAR